MDAIKILGTLLSNNAMGSQAGGSILESLLGGGGSSSGAGDILGTLLGGQKRGGGGGGLGALAAILAAAAAKGGRGNTGGMDVLGSLLGSGGGGSVLGSLLGGGAAPQASRGGGGLAGMLGGLLSGKKASAPASGGGAGDLLGSLLGAATSGGGNNPLGSLLGAAAESSSGTNGAELLGMLLGGGQQAAPPKEAQDEAEILIAAMCNAAKSDGTIDEGEKEAILGRLGDLDAEEIAYLKEHLSGPVNMAEFTSSVPDDMDEQVYAFSLMAIKLDTQKEAEYFGALANGLGLDGDTCNRIHAQLGQPEIFA